VTAATDKLPPKRDIIRAIKDQRRRTLAYVSELDPSQFDSEVLPGWRVREVLAHLITTDKATVTGAILPVVFRSTDYLEKWNDRQVPRWADRAPSDLIVGLDRWGRRFARFAQTLPGPLYRTPMPTLWGRGPGGMLVFSRCYDEWIHRHDMRRGLGQPDEEVDLAPVAEFLFRAIRMDTLPKLRGGAGTVGISLDGVPVPEWRYDLASGSAGPSADGPADARIVANPPGFVMTAAGRGTFDDLEKAGEVSIEGAPDLGRTFLAQLRIV
jgi:uncharacterized protein (TIGR03083 family)